MAGEQDRRNDAPLVSDKDDPQTTPVAHAMAIEKIQTQLQTNLEDGLSSSQAASRAEKYGRNELHDGPGVQPLKILVHQVANAMILVMRSTIPPSKSQPSDVVT